MYVEIVVNDLRALKIPTHAYHAIARVYEPVDKVSGSVDSDGSRDALTHLGAKYGESPTTALLHLRDSVQGSKTPDGLREYVVATIEAMVEPGEDEKQP